MQVQATSRRHNKGTRLAKRHSKQWESNIGLAGCGMGLKIEAERGIREIFKARYGIKIGRHDRNTLRFEGRIRDRTGIDGIIIRLKLRFTDLRDIREYQFALETGLINAPL